MEIEPTPACNRCGSTRLFQFEANAIASRGVVTTASLPLVCRGCGQISVDGHELQFPAAIEQAAKNMAQAAEDAARAALVQMVADDNEAQVAKYFAKVYREAYLDGFLRCLAFFRHNMKEGKLKRLRELWQGIAVTQSRTVDRIYDHDGKHVTDHLGCTTATIQMDGAAFEEFSQLMLLGTVSD